MAAMTPHSDSAVTVVAPLDALVAGGRTVLGLHLAAIGPDHFTGLAECLLAAKPEVGDLRQAKTSVTQALKGEHGKLLPGASPVALADGQVVGSLQIVAHPDSPPEVIELFVHPDWRRRGVASAMLASAASRLRLTGFAAITMTAPVSESAVCAALGFEQRRLHDADLEQSSTSS